MVHPTPCHTEFSPEDVQALAPTLKIGLLATIGPQGLPHVTLLSTLMASSLTQLCFGQFTEGQSKKNIFENPKTGFLVMSLAKEVWRGKAVFSHTAREGKEYDYYNNTPMFRYNAYFGVHTVYYLDLVCQTGKADLPMQKIIPAAIKSTIARTTGRKPGVTSVLNSWTRTFFNKLDNLKFLSYVDRDGFPLLIPAIQTQSLDAQHVLFSLGAYTDELKSIPAGTSLAVFGMSLSMEDVLLRGVYQGLRRVGPVLAGVAQVDWVYNSMPPVPGQIYPPIPLRAVEDHW
jgi:hypothetical protein